MKRRHFLALCCGAVPSWPLIARGQQTLPVIGFLHSISRDRVRSLIAGFHEGLQEGGYQEGQTVSLEYRFADRDYRRLPGLAAELAGRPLALIVAGSPPAALAAKAATTRIPIVFVVGFDPVGSGLVASMSRPGGNATGVTLLTATLGQKRLEYLRELVPRAEVIGMLVNPASPDTEPDLKAAQAAAQAYGHQLNVLNAKTRAELDDAFKALARGQTAALLVGSDPFFVDDRDHIVALAARHALPTIYPFDDFASSGGLISYGASRSDAYRQAGVYAARILKGAKPADLPVLEPTKFELAINLKTAKALGLTIPAALLARADRVIE